MLAVLLVNRNRTVSRDQVLELLWEDAPPETAHHIIEVYVSGLRRILEPRVRARGPYRVIVGNRDGYCLHAEEPAVDVGLFEGHLRSGGEAIALDDHPGAVEHLTSALALWRGPALTGLRTFRFAASEARRLEQSRELAYDQLAGALFATGEHQRVNVLLSRATTEHPLSESLAGHLMLARYRCGDSAGAIDVYYHLRRQLADQLAIEPSPRLQALLRGILNREADLMGERSGGSVIRLPQIPDLFVGRSADIDVVHGMTRARRLVAITGIPGVGKTRLAIEAAARCAPVFNGGVYLVELASVRDVRGVFSALGTSLGLQEHGPTETKELVLEFIGRRRVLLVMDNCEYAVSALKTILVEMLGHCSSLHVLATTRDPFGLVEEQTWELAPLAVPQEDEPDLHLAEAVALFYDRVSAFDPSFELRPVDQPAMVQISRRLEGIPLAIELTAPRLRTMSLAQLATALESEDVVEPPEHPLKPVRYRSLEAAIATTYSMLEPELEQFMLALSLFSDAPALPFRVAAVGGISTSEPQLAAIVDALAARALLKVSNDGRVRTLESLRRFGERTLRSRSAWDSIRDRHTTVFADLARSVGSGLEGPGQPKALQVLADEHLNVNAALSALARRGSFDEVASISGLLGRYWWVRGRVSEGRRWLALSLAHPGEASRGRAEAHRILAYMEWNQGRLRSAVRQSQRALKMSLLLGDTADIARSKYYLGIAVHQTGRLTAALEHLREGAHLAEQATDGHMRGLLLDMIARTLNGSHRPDEATQISLEALSLLRAAGDDFGIGVCLHNLAEGWMLTGQNPRAATAYQESMQIFQGLGGKAGFAYGLLGLASAASRCDRQESAARLVGAADAYWESVGFVLLPEDELSVTDALAAANARLGASQVEALRAEGRMWATRPTFMSWVQRVSEEF
jgi:predicted ATPase/DNA-binding SARP family transcriptional activator